MVLCGLGMVLCGLGWFCVGWAWFCVGWDGSVRVGDGSVWAGDGSVWAGVVLWRSSSFSVSNFVMKRCAGICSHMCVPGWTESRLSFHCPG